MDKPLEWSEQQAVISDRHFLDLIFGLLMTRVHAFEGITHDHGNYGRLGSEQLACSTIAILRRHPMYDSLILVKKFRNCLGGYSLEFPSERLHSRARSQSPGGLGECGRGRLVSKFLDGDDPMYREQVAEEAGEGPAGEPASEGLENGGKPEEPEAEEHAEESACTFAAQIDDKGDHCELIHVPINGLMDRLKNYTESGVAVDSRVYAFAMGLKTAERILTTSSMKELQETPI